MDTLAMIDAEETRLLTQLAEVRAAKAVLKRVCGLADPPHGQTGLGALHLAAGPVVTAREATAQENLPPPPPSVSAEAPPGKPEPRPSSDESGRKKTGPAPTLHLRVARFMLEHGTHGVSGMVAAGVGSQPAINETINRHPTWFQKTGPSLKAPWELTEAGRAAVTAASSSAS